MTNKQHLYHLHDQLMSGFVKSLERDLPTEFLIDTPDANKQGETYHFKLTVLAHCSTGTMWSAVQPTFDAAIALHPEFNEVRIHIDGDHVYLCGVTKIDSSKP